MWHGIVCVSGFKCGVKTGVFSTLHFPQMYVFIFSLKKWSFVVTKGLDVEKEASGLLEHPNGRPMASKLNQLGSRGQRKWPLGQRTPPHDHRKGHVHNVARICALVLLILSVKPDGSATLWQLNPPKIHARQFFIFYIPLVDCLSLELLKVSTL